MKLNKKYLDEVKSTIKWMSTAENSAYAEKAVKTLEELQEEIDWLRDAIVDMRQAIWDNEDEEVIGNRLEEIAAYIDLNDVIEE